MTQSQLCPICEKKKSAPEFRPFCSKRCADVDLSKWLSDSYAIPGQQASDAEETPSSFSASRPDKDG
ncbi:MAG: DNA gyrase inhibitor YacG [Ponticaulis sp.]|nr:DNA gyrase inhibitor YacG [Ponticaulis sp.]